MSLSSKLERGLRHAWLRLLERLINRKPLNPADLPHNKIRRILIIPEQDQLGELLLATPVFRAVRQHFPKAYIAVLAQSYPAQILYNNVYLDEVICFFDKFNNWSLNKVFHFVKRLRSKFDLAIVLNTVSHSLTRDLLTYFSGAKIILGSEHLIFKECKRNFFYNLLAPYSDSNKHQTEKNLDVVRFIHVDIEDKSEAISLTQEEKKCAIKFLYEHGLKPNDLILAIHLSNGKIGNRWDLENFVEVAKYFSSKYNAKIIVSWQPNESILGQDFINSLPFRPVTAIGLNLREYAAIISFCNLIFCYDTAIMHLAASVGTPLIAIFGSSAPEQSKPIGKQFVALKGINGECNSVSVNQAIEAAENLLKAMSKSMKIEAEDFDITEQVLEQYLNILNTFEKK
ncbi:MAG: glycosyltransferase family 9 protein [bacterium]